MFCKECGNELKEGVIFCGNCGTKVASENVESVQDSVVIAPTEEGKKKAKVPKALIAVLAVVVVLVGGFFLLKDTVANAMISLMPAETQFQAAYKNSAQKWGEKSGEIVTEASEMQMTSEGTVTGSIAVTVGDSVKGLLENAAGVDFGDLSTVYVKYEVAYKQNQYLFDMVVGLEKTDLLSMNMVMDMKKGVLALTVPEISDSAIEMNFETDMAMNMDEFHSSMAESEAAMELLQDILPDEKLLEDMVPRYVVTIMKAIDEVEREKGTLEVEGVSQKATALTVNLDADMVKKIGVAISNELKEDKDFEKYLKNAVTVIMEYQEEEFTASDWKEGYQELVDGVKALFEDVAEAGILEEGIKIVTWVNSDNEIIGLEVAEYVKVASAKDGKQVAKEIVVSDPDYSGEMVKIAVTGTESKDEFSGDVKIYAEKEEVFAIEVGKYIYTDKKFELDASITITADMFEEMTGTYNPLGDVVLKAEIASTEDSENIILRGIVGGNEWASIQLTSVSNTGKAKITYPKDAMSVDEIEDWLDTVDCSKLVDNLDKSGVLDLLGVKSSELKDTLDQMIEYYKNSYFGDYSYSDYDYVY